MNKNIQQMRLILHFNIDKSIVMRNSLEYNNTDYLLRELLSELIWGKIEYNKNNEPVFKVAHPELEYDKKNIPEAEYEIINYKHYLEWKYKLKTIEEVDNDEDRKLFNEELNLKKIKHICEIVEPGNPGNSAKFRKQFEDMRKRLRVEEKIQIDYGLKLDNTKLDEKNLLIKEEVNFTDLDIEEKSDEDRKNKFRRIFKNSYFKIILSFYDMMIALKKAKREFAIVFRFFGHSEDDIQEFFYEFNHFCDGTHPRYNGEFGTRPKFDGSKGTKDYRIHIEKMDNIAVSYRSKMEKLETFAFETLDTPENDDIEAMRDDVAEFYEGNNIPARICKGYNNIFLTEVEKLSQYCSFVILDDYNFYKANNDSNGKLLLIDPYDYDTLQIFFDSDLEKSPDKIDVVDVVNKTKLKYEYCIDKFIVNVEPRKAIMEKNYFLNKIEICETNRINEIKSIGVKEFPIIPITQDFNLEKEIKKISSDKYLEMTIFPLLSTALSLVDQIRPNEPVPFIANFMLKNKHTMKNLDEFIKNLPKAEEESNEREYEDNNEMMNSELNEENMKEENI